MQESHNEFRESDSGCIDIGLVNNMPDTALQATERQFRALLGAAADGITVRLTLFALPGVPRTELGSDRVRRLYASTDNLFSGRIDGLIVTGTEPRASDLREEPYWGSLTELLDWAEGHSDSIVCSCLAAHAAVLHMDGIGRNPRADKCFGVFDCAPVATHELMTAAPPCLRMPHSRWNELSEQTLTASGYRVLTRSKDAGVDAFVKQRKSLFVFFQGHPEYEADTLLFEYRRDIRRFLTGERETYPPLPAGYFDNQIAELLIELQERARSHRSEDLLTEFPTETASRRVTNTWRPAAVSVYRNWLRYLRARKQQRLRARIAASAETLNTGV